jgi:hypothetical protein
MNWQSEGVEMGIELGWSSFSTLLGRLLLEERDSGIWYLNEWGFMTIERISQQNFIIWGPTCTFVPPNSPTQSWSPQV